MRRRRAAVLAADLYGYTRLVARDEAGTLARLLADRRSIAEVAAASGGRVFNTAGDAVLAEFPAAAGALSAAVEVQRRLERRGHGEPEDRRMRYRIGIALGDVVEEGADLLGGAVNEAARLQKLAEPGGICLSRDARAAAGAAAVPIRDIGAQRLKNMPRPVPACLISPEAIGVAPARRPRPWLIRAAAVAALAAGSAAVLSAGRARPDAFVFPPDLQLPSEARAPAHRPAGSEPVPFATDADRRAIAEALARDPASAVALARGGGVGLAPGQADPERAGEDAVRRCFEAGNVNCRVYEAGGDIVWPEPPPPLPPEPWVDPAAPRSPFDAARIAGLNDEARGRLAREYGAAVGHKALALGPLGRWWFTDRRASDGEAMRIALERCGANVGTPCRVVAVGDSFVVPLRRP